jgi:hypothetical protein
VTADGHNRGDRDGRLTIVRIDRQNARNSSTPKMHQVQADASAIFAARAFCTDAAPPAVIGRDEEHGRRRQSLGQFRMFGARHDAIVTCETALGTCRSVDCDADAANFPLASKAADVGAIAQTALARYAPLRRNQFGPGCDRLAVCGISFGGSCPDHPVNGVRAILVNGSGLTSLYS